MLLLLLLLIMLINFNGNPLKTVDLISLKISKQCMFLRLLIKFQETISQISMESLSKYIKHTQNVFNEIHDCAIAADNVINIKNKYIECDVAR